MRRFLSLTVPLSAVAMTLVVAGGASGVAVPISNLLVTGSMTFTPKALPATAPAPISLNLSGRVRTRYRSQPPALRKLVVEVDRSIAFTAKGYPACKHDGYDIRRSFQEVEAACRNSILGRGSLRVSVKFPEQPPVPTMSPLILLNGGEKGGMTQLYAYASLTQPITTAIVAPVEVRRSDNGRYGTRTVVSIPPIAGGAGVVTGFNLSMKAGVLSAECAARELRSAVEAAFDDGAREWAELISSCTSRNSS